MDESTDIRVDVDWLFAWLRDMHSVGMASRAVIRFEKMYFIGGVLIQEL